jgi:chromosome segregation ATPase
MAISGVKNFFKDYPSNVRRECGEIADYATAGCAAAARNPGLILLALTTIALVGLLYMKTKTAFLREISTLKETLVTRDSAMDQLRQSHAGDIQTLKTQHQTSLAALDEDKRAKLQQLEAEKNSREESLRHAHKSLEESQRAYEGLEKKFRDFEKTSKEEETRLREVANASEMSSRRAQDRRDAQAEEITRLKWQLETSRASAESTSRAAAVSSDEEVALVRKELRMVCDEKEELQKKIKALEKENRALATSASGAAAVPPR